MFLKNQWLIFFMFGSLLLTVGCDQPDLPLDAHSRRRVDSLSNAMILQTNKAMDSLCAVQQNTVLPHLIDSIRQRRLKEIEENLKSVKQME